MNKKIISVLLLVIMFSSPFAFALSVGGLGTITGKFSYGGVEYTAKDGDTIIRDSGREYTKKDGLWGFIGGASGEWIAVNDATLDPNWKSFQKFADQAAEGFVKATSQKEDLGKGTSDTSTLPIMSGGKIYWNPFDFPSVGSNEATTEVSEKEVKTVTPDPNLESKSKVKDESGSSKISQMMGLAGGTGLDALVSGVSWGVVAFGAGQMVGPILGFNMRNTNALSAAFSAGAFAYRSFSVWDATSGTLLANPLVGIGVGALVLLATYREEKSDVVEFECMPWQAPSGGDDCELCNDADLPCSEYRCKSLGQNCEIVNSGTVEEKCVAVDHNDVAPPIISPNDAMLTLEYKYANVKNSPPGPGFEIIPEDSNKDCLEAFSPLAFGVNTDEPAQCKIDFSHTGKFDEMMAYMGGSNLYIYNHSEKFSLPGVAILEKSPMELENGKDLTFFIRCKDKSGNENSAEYAIRFCVDPTPDSTAPRVEASSIMNGGCIAEGEDSAEVEFYTNEPAECRWSYYDQDYDSMQEDMVRSGSIQLNSLQVFSHISNLAGIAREDTKFYIRCKDLPGADDSDRNKMRESFEFSLRGSTGLKMKNLQPSEKIFGVMSSMPIDLHVETLLGCNNGQAVCSYSSTYNDKGIGYIAFFETNSLDGIHNQRLNLGDGAHEFFIRCVDEGGNLVEDSIKFELDIDPDSPIIARIYEEAQMLKVVTVMESECSYSLNNCDFSFEEGTVMPYANSIVHIIDWDDKKTFYIKCRDEFRAETVGCSAIVRPMRNFL